ncbi:MAG: sigma-70 family RNA polymerase sigma factor [Sedimentisphaerales bacterium]|nr:sigma-70 family RNA polymerase sigma factor [Sedimentisphaerales bacterium]
MENTVDYVRLVKRAQLGEKASLDKLTEVAEERLRVDVFRLTLREDLAQEIVQESLFEMLRVLNNLKDAHRFWPWLYKIALNKMRLHYRTETRRKAVTAAAVVQKHAYENGGDQAMAGAISEELREIVIGAMRSLKPRHRIILTMRCYREMDYAEIAESMDCSEFAAKMLFYRAKKSLRKQLARFGFGRSMLLSALVLFGKITARSEAAAHLTISGAAMKVGAGAGIVGFATSSTGIVSVAVASVLAVGAAAVTTGPAARDYKAAHAGLGGDQVVMDMGSLGRGNEELWCYHPGSVNGPVMMRLMRRDSDNGNPYCSWLQNEQAAYRFDKDRNTVFIENHRIWREDMSVWRLPTDEPELSEFLSRVEGRIDKMRYVRTGGPGLLVVSRRAEQDRRPIVTRHFNVLDEQYFLYAWPACVNLVDNRDAMHKRGWTYFRVAGRIDDDEITGTGRIPFSNAARSRFGPWLKLRIGGNVTLGDNGLEARVYDNRRLVAGYGGESFFEGLSRPWIGLHTIDMVRRDAARRRVWFETTRLGEEHMAAVSLSHDNAELTYTINMEKDIIERIDFVASDGRRGELKFTYLEDIEGLGQEFVCPQWENPDQRRRRGPDMLWLLNLVDGKW